MAMGRKGGKRVRNKARRGEAPCKITLIQQMTMVAISSRAVALQVSKYLKN